MTVLKNKDGLKTGIRRAKYDILAWVYQKYENIMDGETLQIRPLLGLDSPTKYSLY